MDKQIFVLKGEGHQSNDVILKKTNHERKIIKNRTQRNPVTGNMMIIQEDAKQHRRGVFQRAQIPSSVKNALKHFANH